MYRSCLELCYALCKSGTGLFIVPKRRESKIETVLFLPLFYSEVWSLFFLGKFWPRVSIREPFLVNPPYSGPLAASSTCQC